MNLAAAVVAGLLLAASDHPLHLWWLQFVAFVPFWWGLWRQRAAGRRTWTYGLAFAATYAVALLLAAGFALPIAVAALASLLQWALAATLAARHLGRGAVRGPLAAAGMVTLVELATWHLVPMFGTAQAFVRPLSAAPMLVAFVAFTGVGGLVFVVAALQALLVAALRGPSRWPPIAVALALVASVAAMNSLRWNRPLGASVRAAAYGWGASDPIAPDGTPYFEMAPSLAAAAACDLLVTPEVGVSLADRDAGIERFGAIAAQHRLALALGIWHEPTEDNRLWFFDAAGRLTGEYRKTHLVPFFERYATGDGSPVVVPFAGTRLGGMICQDDNFTDLARSYGRLGVPLVAVPTNDWPDIREFHLENAVFRAIENGYAIVRAASGGISALISPRGEIVQRVDHVASLRREAELARQAGNLRWERGPELLHAELPLGDGIPTIYARYGDTPILLLGTALVLISLRRRRSPA